MPNNNPEGHNQHAAKQYPSQQDLYQALLQYSKEKMPLLAQLEMLWQDFGLDIGRDTLINIRCGRTEHLPPGCSIPSSRRPGEGIDNEHVRQTVLAMDAVESAGPRAIHDLLRIEHNIHFPRDKVRSILLEERPLLFDIRQPGYKEKLPRKRLHADGAGHQISIDCHKKTGQMAMDALGLGPVGIDIYGKRDKWSGAQLVFSVTPDGSDPNEVAHMFLDMCEFTLGGRVPLQLWADYGHETATAFRFLQILRRAALPELSEDELPSAVQTYSVHNTPSEANWRQYRKQFGLNTKQIIASGVSSGYYRPNDELEVTLFRWLWPKIIQNQNDHFVNYWNHRTIRLQEDKLMPSGHVPATAFQRPQLYGGRTHLYDVDQAAIAALRATLPQPLQWVTAEFAGIAELSYEWIGKPELKASTGWQTFTELLDCIRDRHM